MAGAAQEGAGRTTEIAAGADGKGKRRATTETSGAERSNYF